MLTTLSEADRGPGIREEPTFTLDTFPAAGYWIVVQVLRLAWLSCCWLLSIGARADDVQARELFEAGVQASVAQEWSEAARLFEASLAHRDKPACRVNLVVVYRELQRPLEVARNAIAFLATVEGRSHAEAAEKVRASLTQATGQLVTLLAAALPLGVQLKIDGAQPRVVDGSRIYELPGLHHLELWLGDRLLESIEIELHAATVQPWPRAHPVHAPPPDADHAQPQAPADASPSSHLMRKRFAWTLGIAGAVAGVAATLTYGYVAHRAGTLPRWDIKRPGYTEAADRYTRVRMAVVPLAFSGGALMASATTLVSRRPRAALTISIAALAAGVAASGVGAALMARTPQTVIEDAEILRPSRQAASLLLGAALPLLTYGVRLQWTLWREPLGAR